jgi:Tfp pilus assembly protein PilO
VKILTITPSDLKPVDQGKKEVYYYEMPVLITAKSGYHELGGFIAEIETEKRFITIEGLKLEYNKSTPLRHNVNMTLKTYVSVDEDDV